MVAPLKEVLPSLHQSGNEEEGRPGGDEEAGEEVDGGFRGLEDAVGVPLDPFSL